MEPTEPPPNPGNDHAPVQPNGLEAPVTPTEAEQVGNPGASKVVELGKFDEPGGPEEAHHLMPWEQASQDNDQGDLSSAVGGGLNESSGPAKPDMGVNVHGNNYKGGVNS